ncbi:MAG: nucleotidyltransferase domain-containing protein [Paraburkholderia tropica]|nr:nucleotidyltransferase domain-containing protein [Paraburkholderia tropica]MBB2999051.1 putative nucleotidyltransferase [Paraburkholderia tropica]MBB6319049.1 putative nucleotidyltransferase [Paraburkholderia tropica]MDE1138782.1 nucleotidyltransferase domain-containing protein [Paraburkholderia tropica]RQN40327.1 nucleotidyltransferase domain-containing protein [Paraburkholderia tropica]
MDNNQSSNGGQVVFECCTKHNICCLIHNNPRRSTGAAMNEALFSELFGGSGRYKVLRHLFEHPAQFYSARRLAEETGVDPGNIHRWLRKWTDVGILCGSGKTGYQASLDPALVPLGALFRQSSELVDGLRNTLEAVPGIVAAVIFGSYARGEEKAESDIDVLIVGDVPELKVNALLKPLARRCGRPINASVIRPALYRELVNKQDAFVTDVLHNPTIPLIGALDAHT